MQSYLCTDQSTLHKLIILLVIRYRLNSSGVSFVKAYKTETREIYKNVLQNLKKKAKGIFTSCKCSKLLYYLIFFITRCYDSESS